MHDTIDEAKLIQNAFVSGRDIASDQPTFDLCLFPTHPLRVSCFFQQLEPGHAYMKEHASSQSRRSLQRSHHPCYKPFGPSARMKESKDIPCDPSF